MNPTSTTARTGESRRSAGAFTSWREVCMVTFPASAKRKSGASLLTLLEVDFTTEGSQPNRRGRLVDGACEGTPLASEEGSVGLRLHWDVVLNFAFHGLCFDIDGCVGGNGCVDVAGVAIESVFAGVAEVAVVTDCAAGGTDPHKRATNGNQADVSADRVDFDVAVADVVQCYWAVHRLDMDVAVRNVADLNGCGGAFHFNVAVQLLGAQGAGGRAQRHARVCGNLNLVVNAGIFGSRALEQVRLHIDAITALRLIDFNFVGIGGGADENVVAGRGAHGHSTVLVDDRDGRLGTDVEAIFLFVLRDG